MVTLLGSLPQSYSTLVTALEAHIDDVRLNFAQERRNKNDQDLHIEPKLQKKDTQTWIQLVQERLQCHLAQRTPLKRTNGWWTLEHQVI